MNFQYDISIYAKGNVKIFTILMYLQGFLFGLTSVEEHAYCWGQSSCSSVSSRSGSK